MAVFVPENVIGHVLKGLETFFQQTVAMNIFEELHFNYKVKSNFAACHLEPSALQEFLDIVGSLNFQLQELAQKYTSYSENKCVVDETQFSFCNDDNTCDSHVVLCDENLSNDSSSASQENDVKDPSFEKTVVIEELNKTRKRGQLKRSCVKSYHTLTGTDSSESGQSISCFKNVGKTDADKNSCSGWPCNFCKRMFATQSRLKLHVTLVHSQMTGDATECSVSNKCDKLKLTTEKDEEYDVELDRASMSVFCCADCFVTYKTLPEFIAHECQSDPTYFEGNNAQPPRNGEERLLRSWEHLCSLKTLMCGQCMEEYRSLRRMVHHLPRCKPGPYTCELCPLHFLNKRELNYHKKKKHTNEKSFFCDVCGLAFKLRTSLQKHLVKRHENNQGPQVCEDCGQSFSKKIQLTNHRTKEHGLEKNFLCQVCGNKFSTQSSLTAHLETHTGQKRFACSFCNRSFQRKEKLIFHTRIHTGERPFECDICRKSFIRKSKLDEHIRRHKGERRFECNMCTKKYAAAWDLRKHISNQHSKRKTDNAEDTVTQEESSNNKGDIFEPTLASSDTNKVEIVSPNIISSNLSAVATGPTIIPVDSLQLSSLEETAGAHHFILPHAPSTLQIQLPLSIAHSIEIASQQGQQILLTGLGNFDVTGNLPFCNGM